MGIVQRFERKLEDVVGDAFARVFGGSIVPQEVQASLRREAADGVRSAGQGRLLAPNEFFVLLSTADHEKAADDRDLNPDTFAELLREYIRDQGWQTYGEVVVRFEQSPNLHTGQFRTRGVVNPDSKRDRPHGAVTTAPPTPDPQPGAPMTDNPGPQQGRPGEEYGREDDRYGRPDQDPRGQQPQGGQGYPPRQGGYEGGGYGQGQPYGQDYGRPPAGYDQGGYQQRPPQQGGYDQGGYGAPPQAPQGGGDYGRPPARRSRVADTAPRRSRAATASLRAPTTASTSRVAAMAAANTAASRAPLPARTTGVPRPTRSRAVTAPRRSRVAMAHRSTATTSRAATRAAPITAPPPVVPAAAAPPSRCSWTTAVAAPISCVRAPM
ncbi:hypothetical protein I543_0015 [Mycobacteroides abscessus 21]|uniref:FhaA N-terminal domain-containing protein n=1 Tax=Mycobacteroides abscessus 21 TaxID=1299324 RepID=A0A829PZY5_9MYCO|nr:hypothetical protein I543_0015 [Mycobacteroides abscessus 21]